MAERRSKIDARAKSIFEFLSGNEFLIPIYQRPYEWGLGECEALWEDIIQFYEAQSGGERGTESYFLGSIVAYRNEKNELEIIDGQQRTTTLMLLLKALYDVNKKANSERGGEICKCLWEIDKNAPRENNVMFDRYRLKSDVVSDDDETKLKQILMDKYDPSTEKIELQKAIKKSKSNYEKNYLYFTLWVRDYLNNRAAKWEGICETLLERCEVLLVESEDGREGKGFDYALRIFNTLNNRGKPLADSDIIKGRILTKRTQEDRNKFAQEWKALEDKVKKSEYVKSESDRYNFMSELWTHYMHILRAKNGDNDTTTPGMLQFFAGKSKLRQDKSGEPIEKILVSDESFEFIKQLAQFYCNPYNYLSPKGAKYYDVLDTYQNNYWKIPLSVCIYKFRESHTGELKINEAVFEELFPKLITCISLQLFQNKGGTTFLKNIFVKTNITLYESGKFDFNIKEEVPSQDRFEEFCMGLSQKNIKYLLLLDSYLFSEEQQRTWSYKDKRGNDQTGFAKKGEVEHILPKEWQKANFDDWDEASHKEYLEKIGNKVLLEKQINIACSNGFFHKKKEEYKKSHFLQASDDDNGLSRYPNENWTTKNIDKRSGEIYQRLQTFFNNNKKG